VAPKITITCDCGEQRRLDYGEAYTCDCGRHWSTSQIPEADYAAIVAVDDRFRRAGWALLLALALIELVILLTQPLMSLIVVPAILLGWFMFGRPYVRSRHYKAVRALTKSWNLRPEGPPS
jgi:hypothetical protein